MNVAASAATPDPATGAGLVLATPVPDTGGLSLRRNFSWTLAGNVVNAAGQLCILVVLAKVVSSTAVGSYALATAMTVPVFTFFSLKLRSVQATDIRGEHNFSDYLALRLLTTALALLVMAGLAFAGSYVGDALLVVALVTLAKAVDTVSDVLHGLFQLQERMDIGAKALILKGTLSIAALAAAMYVTRNLVFSLAAMTGTLALVLFVYEIPQVRRALAGKVSKSACWRFDWHRLWSLTVLTLPLGVTLALNALSVNVPRYFLAWSHGEREVGIFTTVASPLMAGSLIVTALAQSAAPRLARYHAEGRHTAFNQLVLRLSALGGLLGICGLAAAYIAGPYVLRIVYTEEYARHADLLLWQCAGVTLAYTYLFCGSAFSAMRRFKVQLPIHVASLAVMVGACAWLVPHHGLRGAAIALLVGYAAEGAAYIAILLYVRRRAGQEPASSAIAGVPPVAAAVPLTDGMT